MLSKTLLKNLRTEGVDCSRDNPWNLPVSHYIVHQFKNRHPVSSYVRSNRINLAQQLNLPDPMKCFETSGHVKEKASSQLCWNLLQPHSTCSNMRANEVVTTYVADSAIYMASHHILHRINQSLHDFQQTLTSCMGTRPLTFFPL